MKSNLLTKTLQIAKSLSLPLLASLAITSCGGGGGGGTTQVAPSSLDRVRLRLFDAFTLEFQRRSGTAGDESGVALYSPSTQNFRVASVPGGVGRDVIIPDPGALDGMTYKYTRNSPTTGTITLNFKTNQVYPHPTATKDKPGILEANMFLGGDNSPGAPKQTQLKFGVLFAEASGSVNPSLTASVDHYTDYLSTFTDPGPAKTTISVIKFDTKTANFRLTSGGSLPINYAGPVYGPNEAFTGMWTGLSNPKRNIRFFGATERRIRHASTTSAPTIPINNLGGSPIIDSGIISIDVASEGIANVGGAYSYANTGGSKAKLTIQYNGTTTVHYDLDFTSEIRGSYTDSNGESGTFEEDKFTDNPTY